MRKIVVFGATSAIAIESCRAFALDGDALLLIARDSQKLEALQNDLLTRGAKEVYTLTAQLDQIDQHEKLLTEINEILPEYDTVLVAYGVLGEQSELIKNYQATEQVLRTNFTSVVSLLTPIANIFEARRSGSIAVISSVAGDRGRQSNYIYGCSKGALSIFLDGLRNRLYSSNVNVLTIKPGFVDTPMTADIKKGPLFASAEKVGAGIYEAIKARADVVYLPFWWQGIMLVIKTIPEIIFKRLKL